MRFPKKEITGVLAVPFNTHRTTKIDIGEGTEGTNNRFENLKKGLKMGKRSPYSTNTAIKAALHRLWLRSRERSGRLKMDGYCCQKCGVKQSKAKGKEVSVNVHHIEGIRWKQIIEYIRQELLVKPEKLETLCKPCHKDEHKEED